MRAALPFTILPFTIAAATLLCACHAESGPSKVADRYDNRAAEIERQGEQQSSPVARKIYQSRADAVRAEGAERKAELEKAGTDAAPPIPATN